MAAATRVDRISTSKRGETQPPLRPNQIRDPGPLVKEFPDESNPSTIPLSPTTHEPRLPDPTRNVYGNSHSIIQTSFVTWWIRVWFLHHLDSLNILTCGQCHSRMTMENVSIIPRVVFPRILFLTSHWTGLNVWLRPVRLNCLITNWKMVPWLSPNRDRGVHSWLDEVQFCLYNYWIQRKDVEIFCRGKDCSLFSFIPLNLNEFPKGFGVP